MKKEAKGKAADRREFLKLAGVSAATGGVALVSAVTPAAAAITEEDKDSDLYRETQHIKTYYDLARF